MRSEIQLSIRLEVFTRKDDDVWLAWCAPLDVSSQAETQAAAVQSLKEAVELWFESCLARGVLDKALKEAGFKIGADNQASATGNVVMVSRKPEYIEVTIPAYIAAAQLGTSAPC